MPEQEAQGALHDLYPDNLDGLGCIANYVRAEALGAEGARGRGGLERHHLAQDRPATRQGQLKSPLRRTVSTVWLMASSLLAPG